MFKTISMYSILFLALLFASYYIGLTITSVVDQRLQDVSLTLPRPKVYINYPDKKNKRKRRAHLQDQTNVVEGFENFKESCTPKKFRKLNKKHKDKATKRYVKQYSQHIKNIKPLVDNSPFSAYNYEELGTSYTTLEKANDKILLKASNDEEDATLEITVSENQICPEYRFQRPWQKKCSV